MDELPTANKLRSINAYPWDRQNNVKNVESDVVTYTNCSWRESLNHFIRIQWLKLNVQLSDINPSFLDTSVVIANLQATQLCTTNRYFVLLKNSFRLFLVLFLEENLHILVDDFSHSDQMEQTITSYSVLIYVFRSQSPTIVCYFSLPKIKFPQCFPLVRVT